MINIKKTAIRIIRKSAHLTNRAFNKIFTFTTKVENKATRILNGTDFSLHLDEVTPLEKIYYNSLRYIIPINPALPHVNQKASIVLFLPTLDNKSFYGGTATALIVAGRAAELTKKPLRIVQTLKTGANSNLESFFKGNGINLKTSSISVISVADRAYNIYGYLPMHADDIFIASAWWDAYLINQLPLLKKYIYLIQDFEPIFYNNSDQYVLAESTYKTDNFIPLCNTELMYDFMKARKYTAFNDGPASWFEPAVSQLAGGDRVRKKSGEKKRLFLYGRPDVHRNLFFTALNAIDYSIKAGFLDTDNWDFYMAGQDSLPDIKLTSGAVVRNKGKMDMGKYVRFSKTIDLAVSPMMAPHPNYPTLEFASIGASVVTTKYANKQDLSNYSANIFMSDIDAESMAGAINLAAKAAEENIISPPSKTNIPDSWSASLDAPLLAALDRL